MHQPSPHSSPHMRAQASGNAPSNNISLGTGGNNATQHIENLCDKVFGNSSPQEKQMAQAELNKLQTSTDNIPICQQVLANSQNPYALVAASQALTSLITTHWNNFTTEQRVQIRNYILDYRTAKTCYVPENVRIDGTREP